MNVFPGSRMLVAAGAWVTAAVVAAVWPVLLPAVLVFLLLLAALVAVDARLLAGCPAPDVTRIVPDRALQGEETELLLRVANRADRSVRVDLVDELPGDVAPQDPAFADVRLAPKQARDLGTRVRPRARGDRKLGIVTVLQQSPLGLLRRRARVCGGAVLCVYPDARRFLRREALDPRWIRAHLGIRPARRRGEGMDFESLRDYVVGDDPRRVDWAATARSGRLITRVHQHERNHTVVIALDTSRLMGARCGERTKLDFGVDAALALGTAALAHGDRVEVVLFDREVHGHVAPRVHHGELGPLVELLRHAQPRALEPDYGRLARSLAARRHHRALVVVLTDFVEATSAGFAAPLRMLQKRHRTLLVALRDPLFAALDEAGPAEANLYRRIVLDDLLTDRELALARLRRHAVMTLDLPPERIVAPLLNRYLEIRFGPDR